MNFQRLIPWFVALVAFGSAMSGLFTAAHVRGFDMDAFGKLPVLEGGRVKPLDSIARNSLLMIRSQQSFRFGERTVSADEWLLDVLLRPGVADTQPIFNINDPDVLSLMGIKQTTDHYFSFQTMGPYVEEIQKQADLARPIEAKKRSRFQSAVTNLFDRIYLYYRLKHTLQFDEATPLAAEIAAASKPDSVQRQVGLAELAFFRPIPGARTGAWRSVGESLQDVRQGSPVQPALTSLGRMCAGYMAQDPGEFNAAVHALRTQLTTSRSEDVSQASAEMVFNRAQPFYTGMVLYVIALLLLFGGWVYRPALLQRTAYFLLLVGLSVHTAGLVSRIVLQGRPPVTNLYSSAVFVGWGAVVLGAILERMYRNGFGTAVATASGFASLIVAHHLAGDGDTMEMMRAVLDSNFWLATHVVTITIGYSGTFLAGAIAIGYAIRRHFLHAPDAEKTKSMVSMTYGIICFALLFSFVGTVLGGIWADQSWGRFWGWDPKENGALLIVLWNAIILHARWGGYARERGIMAMAIFGNVITACSWFGVNMLGVGLHSYGFMDEAFWALTGFCAAQMILIVLCLLPPRFWNATPNLPRAAKA